MPDRTAVRSLLSLAFIGTIAFGCAEIEPPTAPDAPVEALMAKGAEEEIFGSLYVNGVPITSSNYYVTLEGRHGLRIGPPIWVNPAKYPGGWMYGWFDRRAWDGPCRIGAADRSEQHGTGLDVFSGPSRAGGSGYETHCVDAGESYVFKLYYGNPDFGSATLIKKVEIDYPEWYVNIPVRNQQMTGQPIHLIRELMEAPTTGTGYHDIYLSVDLAGSGTDNPVLWIDNAGPSIGFEDSVFVNMPSPTGTTSDYFRFSFIGTGYTSSIAEPRQQRPMAKMWVYRGTQLISQTGYYTFNAEWPLQRTMRFPLEGTYEVAVDIMRPDEAPRTFPAANALRRTIVVTADSVPQDTVVDPPNACFSREAASTWRRTPQTLDATCTTNEGAGATYRWRWTTNSAGSTWSGWTPASTNPRFDFGGHAYAGTQKVELQVTGQNASNDTQVLSFTVSSNQVTLSGPTLVCAKGRHDYTSNVTGPWFERWPPATTWSNQYVNSQLYPRVWSAGTYDVVLRQQPSNSPLGRGELRIQVRTQGGCVPEE